MIFVTVGAQMPFDRMVRAVDRWAARAGRKDVFAQISETDFRPTALEFVANLPPPDYLARLEAADLVIGHAGMGTIITCAQLGKPLLVMPRREALRETRNDHQVATATRFADRGWVKAAMDEHELERILDDQAAVPAVSPISNRASEPLLTALRAFVQTPR